MIAYLCLIMGIACLCMVAYTRSNRYGPVFATKWGDRWVFGTIGAMNIGCFLGVVA